MKKLFILILFAAVVFSCKKEKATDPIPDPGNEEITLDIPQGFPYPFVPSDKSHKKVSYPAIKSDRRTVFRLMQSAYSVSYANYGGTLLTAGVP